MSKKLTFNLIDIYTDINTFISQMILVVNEMLDEDYILPTEFGVYIFTPIWRRFKNSNACFENSEEGIASFKDNFTNQIQEIGFDFFSWCKANIEYFKTITDETNKNKSFSKQLNTGIYPVNENLQQTATQTQFATGTTNQNIVEIISNGIGWYKASQQFMTPQKKNDMLNSFKWLFIKYSNATKNEYTVLEIDKTGLIPVGDADYVEIVDDNLKSENIKSGVKILGIEGSAPLPKEEQSKSFSVTRNQILNVYPDTGKVLNEVVVDVAVPPTPTEEKTVNITDNGSTVVIPTTGSVLSKVTINTNVETIQYIPFKLLCEYNLDSSRTFTEDTGFNINLQILLIQLQDTYNCIYQTLNIDTGQYNNITITNNNVSNLYTNTLTTNGRFKFSNIFGLPVFQLLVPLSTFKNTTQFWQLTMGSYTGSAGSLKLTISPFEKGVFVGITVNTGLCIGISEVD
jgi:flagellar hook-basal body complex protein FliE